MAHKAHKTEHAGAKKRKGAYWGRKAAAKRDSKKQRRQNDRRTVFEERAALHA